MRALSYFYVPRVTSASHCRRSKLIEDSRRLHRLFDDLYAVIKLSDWLTHLYMRPADQRQYGEICI